MPIENAPFSAAEYRRRIDKTRAAMERAGIDVLFAADPSNQAWLTGYDGWSFYVHQGVILRGDGDPIWWGRQQDTWPASFRAQNRSRAAATSTMSERPVTARGVWRPSPQQNT